MLKLRASVGLGKIKRAIAHKEVIMEKLYSKDNQKFVVRYEKGEVFIGTAARFSDFASQILCHNVMKPLGWRPSAHYRDLVCDGKQCVGVGYYVPSHTSARKAIGKLFS